MNLIHNRKWKPKRQGEFPTLGFDVGKWIESSLVIPGGMKVGRPFKLYREQWKWLVHYYRLKPEAEPDWGSDAFVHYGGILVRSQKWGKDPLAAAQIAAHGMGPVEFGGWDEDGRPIAIPHPAPNIMVIATVEEQALNTWSPLMTMVNGTLDQAGPLYGTPGLDIGQTRALFPRGKGGWYTSVAESRLGAPITFATMTESHLYTVENGLVETARALKRNLAGMLGRWVEVTNPWNPLQQSTAQQTYNSGLPGILCDYREPEGTVDLDDKEAVIERLREQYGDALRERGGHMSIERIMEMVYDPTESEGNKRRYFLGETSVGDSIPVRAEAWLKCEVEELLEPGARIGLGFDGSKSGDCTALVAYDVDKHLVCVLQYWQRPKEAVNWEVPRSEVDQAVRTAFRDYRVGALLGDPYFWEEMLDKWAEDLGRVFEFKTNEERRFDEAVTRFQNLVHTETLKHPGQDILTRHIDNAVVKFGKRKPPRNENDLPEFYQRIGKRTSGHFIDVFVAAILAVHAGGYALEKGLFPPTRPRPFAITLK